MTARGEIVHYADTLGNGRAIMRYDVTWDGELVLTGTEGSPAPTETVRRHERRLTLGDPR